MEEDGDMVRFVAHVALSRGSFARGGIRGTLNQLGVGSDD